MSAGLVLVNKQKLVDCRSAAVDGVMERDVEWRDSYGFSWLDATFHRKHGKCDLQPVGAVPCAKRH